jgi:hypothetical protein
MKLKWRRRGLNREAFTPWTSAPKGLRAIFIGARGERPMPAAARDLVRVGLAVHAIERALPGAPSGNRAVEFQVALHLEDPDRWNSRAVLALQEVLAFQGDARWNWEFIRDPSINAGVVDDTAPENRLV